MQIDWWTLLFQIINFLVLIWLLKRFLYHPVQRVLQQRRELVHAATAEAQHSQAQAEAARSSRLASETKSSLRYLSTASSIRAAASRFSPAL